MRIVMISPGFAPEMASENLAASKMALAFLDQGWELRVISRPESGFLYADRWAAPWLPLQGLVHQVETPSASRWQRLGELGAAICHSGQAIAGVRWAAAAAEEGMRLIRDWPPDLILSRSPPDAGHLPAMLMARKTGIPWVAVWNDPPLHLWPEPYTSHAPRLMQGLYARFFRCVCREASALSFPSARLAEQVLQRGLGDPADVRLHIAPHICPPGPRPDLQAPADGPLRVVHAGNLSPERSPACLFQALTQLRRERGWGPETLIFQFVGVGGGFLQELAAQAGVEDWVRAEPALPYLETVEKLVGGHVSLLLEAAVEEGIFLPGKLADYAYAGRPILALSPVQGEVRDYLEKYGGGLTADTTSPTAIARALVELVESRNAGRLAALAPDDLCAAFSPKRVCRQFEELFSTLGVRGGTVNE